ncbi:hypothetical protein AAG906_009239 [Vitis piasezkii]
MKPLLSYDISGLAMRTTVDFINLSPSYPLEGDILERVWTGKFVSFEHFKTSGPSLTARLDSVSSCVIQMKSLMKNMLIWVQFFPNSMGHNEHREVVQEEQVDTVDRNDESAVDDVEENPTVENDGLEQ